MKRGRPVGSKNKPKAPKTIKLMSGKVIPATFAKPIDWEKLAKDLQTALAKEIKENQDLYKQIAAKETIIVQQIAIIQYLEQKFWTLFNSKE